MAIPVLASEHVRAILKGRWDDKVDTNNVFYFEIVNATTSPASNNTLQNVGRGLWNTISAALLILTSSVQEYKEIVVEGLDADANLVTGESYFIPTGEGVGGGSAESLPPADAYTFRYVRPDSGFRHGFKRFAGIPEEDQSKGFPATAAVSSLDALAALLQDDFHFWYDNAGTDTDAGGLIRPALCQRVLNGDVVSPVVFYTPSAVVFDKIGHQDTRDIGRGV